MFVKVILSLNFINCIGFIIMAEKKVMEAVKGISVEESVNAVAESSIVEVEKAAKIKIQQIASSVGCTKSQIATLKGLKLNKVGKQVELDDISAVRGMIKKVKHLLRIF